ncbi:CRISPR-associated endonuclease Cas1 [Thermofilum sp.]|uniref:CRISPR-associated endonuclease Cas1 n=1 Tax=Thermofilum sp. TaxID=1961369 RepID=UPI003166C806
MGDVLLVDKHGAYLGVQEGLFVLRVREEGKWKDVVKVSPAQLDSIVITVEGASISAAAAVLAGSHGIDLVFISGHEPACRLLPATYGSSLKVWLKQLRQSASRVRRAELARAFVEGKIHNQKVILRTFHKVEVGSGRRAESLKEAVEKLEEIGRKLSGVQDWREAGAVEASAARVYWEAVRELVPRELGFTKRLKRWSLPPGEQPDPFNVALNIGYSALAKEVWRAVFIAGLNPYVGFLHARRPGRISLVYDLMEEFRPVAVDRPLIKMARREPKALKQLVGSEEKRREAARQVWKVVLSTLRDTQPPLRSEITSQARKLARAILEGGEYTPYKTRW